MELTFRWWAIALVLMAVTWCRPRSISRDLWFGGGNIFGLGLIFGWEMGVSSFVGASLFWLAFRGRSGVRYYMAIPAFLIVGASLVYYKISQQVDSRPLVILHGLSWSYAALRVIDATHAIAIYGKPLLNPLSLSGYFFPFHMILAGPIGSYSAHVETWEGADQGREETGARFLRNCHLIATGLLFKFVIADYLAMAWFGSNPLETRSILDTAVLFVYVFFDFAGYSAIALGIGRMMGVPTPVNFAKPFAATSVTEFFKRWHCSLGSFVERNIYAPIQFSLTRRFGIRFAVWWGLAALAVSWIFIGLWHRITLTFILYGLMMAAVIWIERFVRGYIVAKYGSRKHSLGKVWKFLGPIYVFIVLTLALHMIMEEMF